MKKAWKKPVIVELEVVMTELLVLNPSGFNGRPLRRRPRN